MQTTHKKFKLLKPLHLAVLATLASGNVYAASFLTNVGDLPGGAFESNANAVSGNGAVVVGYSSASPNQKAFNWVEGGIQALAYPSGGGRDGVAYGVNNNGTVIVGQYLGPRGYEAVKWVNGTAQPLGFLPGDATWITNLSAFSRATGVTADGGKIVGYSTSTSSGVVGGNTQAFVIPANGDGSMVGLQSLPINGINVNTKAWGVSAGGQVVVGQSATTYSNAQAVYWDGGGVHSMGGISGITNSFSRANAANSDGTVIVGEANGPIGNQAFRWTQAAGMVGLGYLQGGGGSKANAVSADGSVVVGSSSSASSTSISTALPVPNTEAFIWRASTGTMINVTGWLASAGVNTAGFQFLHEANGVSADGKTVVGMGTNFDGSAEAFIARVDGAATPTPTNPDAPVNSGIVGLTDLAKSMTQTLAVSSQMEGLTWLSMNGAHHRPLTDLAVGDSNSCAWVSGDAGRVNRTANGYTGLAEVGACHDFAEHGIRVGAGIGSSFSNLKLANSGNSRIQGQYGIAELDWQVPNKPLVASLLGVYGQWDANLKRGYAIAGTQPSTGDTNVTAYSLRARVDWQDALHIGQVAISPRLAYTITRSEIDGYQEQGGSAPANFKDQNSTAQEVRVGLTGKYALNDKVTLLGHTEVAHRFDARGANVSGNINALGVGIGFNQAGNAVSRNWVRVGAEVDYKLSDRSTWNASTFVSSAGQDADITAAVSYRLAF